MYHPCHLSQHILKSSPFRHKKRPECTTKELARHVKTFRRGFGVNRLRVLMCTVVLRVVYRFQLWQGKTLVTRYIDRFYTARHHLPMSLSVYKKHICNMIALSPTRFLTCKTSIMEGISWGHILSMTAIGD